MNEFFQRTRRWQWNCLAGLIATLLLPVCPIVAQTNTNEVAGVDLGALTNPPPAPRRPNIILVLADNVGYGDLGCYGQTRIRTPNLDKLAAEGMRFTSYYSASPRDEAARAALFTGMAPEHNQSGFNQPLSPDALTVAEFLKEQRYHTGLIGIWGLGDLGSATPGNQGFDEFAGFLGHGHARDYYTDRWWRFDPRTGKDGTGVIAENMDGKKGLFVPDWLSLASANFVRHNTPSPLDPHRPFFLCLAFPIPHEASLTTAAPYAGEAWPEAQKMRAAMITRMDEGIGEVLRSLERMKISTNTVVFFTSVNAAQKEGKMDPEFFRSSGSLRGLQGDVYEGGLRVPMIVRWPAQIKPGTVSDLPWGGWDFLPTAAEIAMAKPPQECDGISVLPTLLGQTQTNRHEMFYWESRADGLRQALRSGDWKAVRTGETNRVELYNLKTDANEQRDVASQNSELTAKLEKLLNERIKPATPNE